MPTSPPEAGSVSAANVQVTARAGVLEPTDSARLASFGIVRDPDEQDRHLQAAVRLFLRAVHP